MVSVLQCWVHCQWYLQCIGQGTPFGLWKYLNLKAASYKALKVLEKSWNICWFWKISILLWKAVHLNFSSCYCDSCNVVVLFRDYWLQTELDYRVSVAACRLAVVCVVGCRACWCAGPEAAARHLGWENWLVAMMSVCVVSTAMLNCVRAVFTSVSTDWVSVSDGVSSKLRWFSHTHTHPFTARGNIFAKNRAVSNS